MRFQNYKKIALVFLGLFISFSCVEDQQFLALSSKVSNLDRRLARLEKRVDGLEAKLEKIKEGSAGRVDVIYREIDEIKGAISESESRMDSQYSELLKRIEGLENEIKDIRWEVSVLKGVKESIGMSEETNATRLAPPQGNRTLGPEELYSMALDAYRRGDIAEARRLFNEYLAKYPNTDLSDNALFWIGETYYVEGRYPEAIIRYQEILVKFPGADKVPSALLKLGLSQIKLGNLIDAKVTLEKLIKEYPDTPQARIAQKELKRIGQ